jgi:tetratricopeptide (TPR) repeat protein
VSWQPEDVFIPTELANTYARSFEEENQAARRQGALRDAVQGVLLPLAAVSPGSAGSAVISAAASAGAVQLVRGQRFATEETERARRYGLPTLRHALHARALCPILPAPHARLAAFANLLVRGDPPRVYLERAHELRPADPELTYLLGLQCYHDGRHADAWRYWREVLEQSDKHLNEVVERSARVLPPEEMIDEVLPRRPETLYRTAYLLFPGGEDGPSRSVFLERAAPLFGELPPPLSAKDLHLKAQIHQQLDQPAEAAAAYLAAVAREPHQVEWRLEAARLLYGQKRLREAEAELRRVLADQPGRPDARELLQQVLTDILDGK